MSDWWRGAVIYQIYPRSFQDADGDGVGDLRGIISRLDHVASLGVDGIWLSPIFTSPMDDFGYDVADYCGVDPLFGTLADFDALAAACHERGLKLIIDQVYSHSSDRHPWFTESRASRDNPKSDWYVWADAKPDGSPPNNWPAVFGGPAWTWDARRGQYYLHNFLISQPDLNLHHPEVQAALLQVAQFWLNRGVDGFRLDVANFYTHNRQLTDNPPSGRTHSPKPWGFQRHIHNVDQPETLTFVERLRNLTDHAPGRMMVAELFSDEPLKRMAEYTAPGRFHTAYSFVFLGPDTGAAYFRRQLTAFAEASPDGWPSWAFCNHDTIRVATRWAAPLEGEARDAYLRSLIVLLTSLRGTAFLYQGEELGLPEAQVPFERLQDPEGKAFWPAWKGRDGCRTPMPWTAEAPQAGFSPVEPWLPLAPAHLPLAVDAQSADPDSLLNFTRRWLHWRRGRAALRSGDMTLLSAPEEVLAFTRCEGEDTLLFLFNLGPSEQRLPLPEGDWRSVFDLGGAVYGTSVALPPGTAFCAALSPPPHA